MVVSMSKRLVKFNGTTRGLPTASLGILDPVHWTRKLQGSLSVRGDKAPTRRQILTVKSALIRFVKAVVALAH